MLTQKSDRDRAANYLKRMTGRIGKVNTTADMVLCEEGVSRHVLMKHAALHDGKQPPCLDTMLKGPQFKKPNNAVMFPYSSNYELTHIAVADRGGMQLFPVSERPGAFLADSLARTVYVCRNEIDALILTQLGISATVLTAPSALTYDHFNIILVDSKGAPLPMGEVMEYKKLYQNVSVCFIGGSIFEQRRSHPETVKKHLEDNTMNIYKWFALKVSLGYIHNQRRARFELEDSEITKEELSLVIAELKQIPNSAMVVDWLSKVDVTTRSVLVDGCRVIQSKAGWRFAGSDQMLTNFQLKIKTLKKIKGTPTVSCEIHIADGTVYSMSVPARSLWGTGSIRDLILTCFSDHTCNPKVECKPIPYPNISWLAIASTFHEYRNSLNDTTDLGFEDFAAMYNQIFSDTRYRRPSSISKYAKHGDRTLGYWHHETNDLWISQARLLGAIIDLTGNKKLTRESLNNCFGDTVKRKATCFGDFFIFPQDMLEVKGTEDVPILEFKLLS